MNTEAPRNTILVGDVLDRLRELPDGCVQTCVTSPPYWGLRDYGVDGQIGLEPTPAAYVARMVEVFREVRRVLRADGTCWVNLGDSYANDEKWGGRTSGKHAAGLHGSAVGRSKRDTGLKPKDLCGIPWRVAFALQDDGWYLRSDIVWSKPNPMPESVRDRPTRAHEYIFLLSKRARYYYDRDAVRETAASGNDLGLLRGRSFADGEHVAWHAESIRKRQRDGVDSRTAGTGYRNKRSVWTVATEAFPDAHFATFPRKLIEPCILLGSSPQACEHCGAPWARVVDRSFVPQPDIKNPAKLAKSGLKGLDATNGWGDIPRGSVTHIERGWRPTCRCEHNTGAGRCIVLDPFGGSGTTALVAQQWQRDWLLIELNPAYVEMAYRRLSVVPVRLFAEGVGA